MTNKNIILIVELKGGLGNQLFQYFHGLYLKTTYKCDLYIDHRTGYCNDNYNREYELFKIINNIKTINHWLLFNIFILKFRLKYFKKLHKFSNYKIYEENITINLNNLFTNNKKCYIYIRGYWQSSYFPLYFKQKLNSIFNMDMIHNIQTNTFLNQIKVALCLRFYEETSSTKEYAINGKIKTIEDVDFILKEFEKDKSIKNYFVFSSLDSNCITLNSNKLITYLTPDFGYTDAVESLVFMIHAETLIITNSSLYWWGAFLGQYFQIGQKRKVYCPDNLLNENLLLDSWIKY